MGKSGRPTVSRLHLPTVTIIGELTKPVADALKVNAVLNTLSLSANMINDEV